MNLRDLQYVVAVADHRHFGKAAQACFAGQSTLSAQVKKFEESLGVTLFERTNRSVSLTPIGEEIVQRARTILEHAEAMNELAKSHRDPLTGMLKLGIIPTLGPFVIPDLIESLREEAPALELIMMEEFTHQLTQKLVEHKLDAIVIATPTEEQDLVARKLFKEPFWLAHHRNHSLYNVEEISDRQLSELPLLLLSEGHCLSDQIKDLCSSNLRADNSAARQFRAASLDTLLQLVSAQAGCTVVPALALRGPWTTGAGIVVKPLKNKKAARVVSIVHRKTFPRIPVIDVLSDLIIAKLPNTVERIGKTR